MSLKRYSIWDKHSDVITPIGEVLTAQQWKERYPIANITSAIIVCGVGLYNGAFFGELSSMVKMYEDMGADFSEATTSEEKLQVIEDFEDAMNHPVDTGENSAEERIAAALEFQNMMSMPTINDDDPDVD